MKKLFGGLAALALGCALLAGCAQQTAQQQAETPKDADPVDVRVGALKGPTAMGMVSLMNQSATGQVDGANYKFEIEAAPDQMVAKIAKGELDIAALPANLASVLYNTTKGEVLVAAINTKGNLMLCDTDGSIHSFADLKGKTIFSSGKGAVPEYVLNYLLKQNGLEPGKDVNIEWKSEHAECVAALAKNPGTIALLPQPFVTAAQMKNPQIQEGINLNTAWDEAQKDASPKSALVMGVVVVRTDFAKAHPETMKSFLTQYEKSIDFVSSHTQDAAKLVGQYDIVPEAVAQKALPECGICFVDGTPMKEELSGYLAILFEQNPKAVGGTLPGDTFYYPAA